MLYLRIFLEFVFPDILLQTVGINCVEFCFAFLFCHVKSLNLEQEPNKENMVTNSQGETLDVKKVVNDRNGFRYKEELGTNPRVFYLPRRQS